MKVSRLPSTAEPITDALLWCTHRTPKETVLGLVHQLTARGITRIFVPSNGPIDSGHPHIAYLPATASESEQILETARKLDGKPFLLASGELIVHDPSVIDEIVNDTRSSVISIELRLSHQLRERDIKVQLEPFDIPWFSRRVVGLGKELIPRWSHGRLVGLHKIGSKTCADIVGLFGRDHDELWRQMSHTEMLCQLIEAGNDFHTAIVTDGSVGRDERDERDDREVSNSL